MNNWRISQGVALATLLTIAAIPSASSAQDFSLTAFGDVNYGILLGDPASRSAADNFQAFGEEPLVKSSQRGFGLVGTDFVLTAELPADIVYLSEVNLQ